MIVAKRQRRLSNIDEIVLSLYARGLTTGDIAAHFAEIYDAQVSKDTVSRITDRVVEEMQAWTSRPLEPVYAAVVVDAINVKVRDGQVANRPVYAAIGVDLEGQKDILGMWFGDGGGESAKFWMVVLTELRNRGVADVFFLVCDGLKGLPDSVNAIWPATIVQTCLIHLIRNSFRFASRKYWDQLSRDLKPIYTAVNAEAAAAALDELDAKWGTRYPAIIRLWRNAWEEFIPFLDYDVEIRKVLCSTNAIESLNARYRRAVKARGHFPTEQAAMKCLYLVTRSLDPKGTGQTRWATRWLSGLGRSVGIAAGLFPQAARRTGRAPFNAPGSPRSAARKCPLQVGVGDLLASVSVTADRYCGRVDQDHSVGSEGELCPTGSGESATELAPPPAVPFAQPPDDPPVHEVAELIQGVLADGVPEVVRPAAQDLVDPGDHRTMFACETRWVRLRTFALTEHLVGGR